MSAPEWPTCGICEDARPDVIWTGLQALCSDCDPDAWAKHHRESQNGDAPTSGRRITSTRMSDVKIVVPRWAWQGRLPLGALTVLVGREGLGKSTLTLELAARLTRGDLEGDLIKSPADVLLVTYEDAIASTVLPRLMAAAADLDRVHTLAATQDGHDGLVSLPGDLEAIEEDARAHQAKLLIVDPIMGALDGKIDSHRDQGARRALAPLAKLAEKLDLAAVAVMHFNKGTGTDVAMRTGGSIGFVAAARSQLAFGRDPDDPDGEDGNGRVLAHAKCNLGPKAPSLRYRVEERLVGTPAKDIVVTSRVVEAGESDVTASDLLATKDNEDRTERDSAKEWLADELADGEWHPSRELHAASGAAGISSRTLQRAGRDLGVEVKPHGFPARSHWRLLVAPPPSGATREGEGGATREPRSTSGNPVDDAPSRATTVDVARLEDSERLATPEEEALAERLFGDTEAGR